MSKLKSKVQRISQPVESPSPDPLNRNKIQSTSSPVRQIHKYLNSIHRQTKIAQVYLPQASNYSSDSLDYQPSAQSIENQKFLRRRVTQLEQENNEYKNCMIEYERLLERNKELEEQMCLLLQELQRKEQENQMKISKNMINTYVTENTITEEDQQHQIQSKETVDIQYIKMENQKLKKLLQLNLKQSISELQDKFMGYLSAIELRMNEYQSQKVSRVKSEKELTIQKLRKSSMNQKSEQVTAQPWNKWDKSSEHSSKQFKEGEVSNFMQFQDKKEGDQETTLKKKASVRSVVNIQFSDIGESSFGNPQPFNRITLNDSKQDQVSFKKNSSKNLEESQDDKEFPSAQGQYLSQSYYSELEESYYLLSYEQTKKKLLIMLELMRKFNQEYYEMVSNSSRLLSQNSSLLIS